ncbi:beta-galactosidase [Haloimpatiens sp. FM7330]|uniref:beta-galactosidase n=1 Tax=Haloimpatiens sp. FM7330 TaxID=3298610 RepID=UPI003626692E
MNKYPYGGGYYPLIHDKSEWKKDLLLMKEAGINIVRTAELFNTWDRIEPEEGKFNFDFLDEFFDLCEELDMKILLGTGTASPPYWIHEKYPDSNILSNSGKQYHNNVSYTWACIDNPGYLKEAERYIRTLVERYKNHNALDSYQLHNEVGFPFMPLENGGLDIYCYCEHSKNKFRHWMKEKYKTLDSLNYAWRWSATNTVCTKWSQVEPPYVKPTAWSSVTRWLDWRLFWMDNFTNFIKWQNHIVKSMDEKHPTTTNIFYMKSFDAFGTLMGLDQFEMAKQVDYIGYDLYPGSGDKLKSRPEFSSLFLDHAKSIAKPLGKAYWIHELESGPINGWMLGPDRNTNSSDLMRNAFECLGHDAKFMLYQGWREWDFQPLHWGGIVDLDGNKTDRNIGCEKIGKFLDENSEYLLKSRTSKGDIAILTSKENSIVINGVGQEEFLKNAIRSAYRIFWEKGFNIDFITPEHLESGYAKDYKAICMPFLTLIKENTAKNLQKYVENGGILIGTARCGMIGEHGWYNHKIPCFNLQNVFGVNAVEVWAKGDYKATYKNKNYDCYWHKERLDILDENVNVIARFFDDTPAATVNKFGKGTAIYFATHADAAYLEKQSYLMWDIIDDIFKQEKIRPYIYTEYTNRIQKEVDVHSLKNEEKEMLIITNYVNSNRINSFFINGKKKIRIYIDNEYDIKSIKDYYEQREISWKRDERGINIELEINKNEIKVLQIVWEVN